MEFIHTPSLMLRVAINGFGRIGRTVFKAGFDRPDVEFVAVNDLTEPKILAHLLKYDSTFRTWGHDVVADGQNLVIDGKVIKVVAEMDPAKLPWKELGIDVVIESTGRFTDISDNTTSFCTTRTFNHYPVLRKT